MQFEIDYLDRATILPIPDGQRSNPLAVRTILANVERNLADGLDAEFRFLSIIFDVDERRFEITAQAQRSNITFQITGHMIGPDSLDPFTPGLALVPVAAARLGSQPFGAAPPQTNITQIWASVRDRIEVIVAASTGA